MTRDLDIERLLDAWFAEGPLMVSDRVVDEAASRLHQQPQQPAWRLRPWRFRTVSTPLRLALIGAALLAVLIGGTVVFSGGGASPGPAPSASPSPMPSPIPSPAVSPAMQTERMVMQGRPMSWTAGVPSGWSNHGWFLTRSQGTHDPSGIAVAAPGGIYVPKDPCDGVGKVSTYKTPADVVAALRSRQDLVVSNAIDSTLGGYSGTRVDVQAPADNSGCADRSFLFAEPDGTGIAIQGPSQQTRMWILDVGGHPTVIQLSSFPATPADQVAEAQQIVDSIVILP
jgi:hypothetical protein